MNTVQSEISERPHMAVNWEKSIDRVMSIESDTEYKTAMEILATQLVDAALNGDSGAIIEMMNHLDGEPTECIEVTGHIESSQLTYTDIINDPIAINAISETDLDSRAA